LRAFVESYQITGILFRQPRTNLPAFLSHEFTADIPTFPYPFLAERPKRLVRGLNLAP
jgi:hypothetical protein